MIKIKKPLHHAYIFTGERKSIVPALQESLKRDAGFETKANPDFFFYEYGLFGIGESRLLQESASRVSFREGKKIFMISADKLSVESQNSMLKLLEDPPADTHFFFVLDQGIELLPTVQSRVLMVPQTVDGSFAEAGTDFLASPIPERIKIVSEILKKYESEKDRSYIFEFLDELETAIRGQGEIDVEKAGEIERVLFVKKYTRDRSPSFKILLEHLAINLPVAN